MTLAVVIALTQLQYFAGDPINLEIAVTNSGTGPVRVPHPDSAGSAMRLQIRGPQQTSRVLARQAASASPAYLELAPGQSWKGLIRVNDYTSISEPGEYDVTLEIETASEPVVSNAVRFRYSPLLLSGFGYGIWADPQEPQAFAVWLARNGMENCLAQAVFVEQSGQDGGIEKRGPITRRKVEPEVAEPFTQSTNYHPLHDLFQWIFWRKGNRVFALSSFDSEPMTAEIPVPEARIIGPALMDRSHAADILVAASDSAGENPTRLWLIRFQDSRQSAQPRIQALPSPGKAHTFAVALDAAGGEDRRHIVSAAVEGSRLELLDFLVARDGVPLAPARRTVELEEPSVMLPDAPPAIAIDRKGTARVAVVVCTVANGRRCRLVEAEFSEREPTMVPVEIAGKPVSARISYAPIGALRRAFAIWTDDGRVWALRDAVLRPIAEHVTADAPRAVISLLRDDYLVEVSPTAGVVLRPF